MIKILKRLYYSFFYLLNLYKLRFLCKKRKIRVGFWVTESAKWTCQEFYDLLKSDDRFEPFILLSYFKNPQEGVNSEEHYNKIKTFFEQKGANVIDTFNPEIFEFKNLNDFKADIIFYQQPWQININQRPEKTHKHSLLCYIPYCFYSMDSWINYLPKFHGLMWKYFVETSFHKEDYQKKYRAKNCVVSGSTKLDGYQNLDKHIIENIWKTKGKKRIIYAPHHSFNDNLHEVATFNKNGKYILELAKSHPEIEWIFRPHPAFKNRVISNSIMSEEELEKYYQEWDKTGTVYTDSNYLEMFVSSDCLITDCISFLTEYAPTGKPVLHLRKDNQKEEFNTLVSKIDDGYYQIYSNQELGEVFNQVIINNDDFLSEKRELNKVLLQTKTNANKNIYDFLVNTLFK